MTATHSGQRTRAAQVAEEIQREILEHRWPIGEVIGSETSLSERFRAGVGVVREAARILEVRGLARGRRGPGGGLVVTAPDRSSVTEASRLYLDRVGVSAVDLFETWLALERLAVTKLAGSIDREGALRLRAAVQRGREESPGSAWEAQQGVHLEIARLTGNTALELFLQVLTDLSITQYSGVATDPVRTARWSAQRHHEIVEAIIEGDTPMAVLHLRRHIEHIIADTSRAEGTHT
jgi:DNA-binding FadR family transcriptional regulator